jgi:membrane protease YdiL (CAAX protease family)
MARSRDASHCWKGVFVLGLFLGPILKESVFRGCMLPVLARTLGNAISVVTIAVLFAAFHAPGDVTHWVWFTATGAAYGSLRLASETTTGAAFIHATCNLTLFLSARL